MDTPAAAAPRCRAGGHKGRPDVLAVRPGPHDRHLSQSATLSHCATTHPIQQPLTWGSWTSWTRPAGKQSIAASREQIGSVTWWPHQSDDCQNRIPTGDMVGSEVHIFMIDSRTELRNYHDICILVPRTERIVTTMKSPDRPSDPFQPPFFVKVFSWFSQIRSGL